MKNIINLTLIISLFAFFSCDTQQDVTKTGVANPIYNGNILEYLRSDDYNWKLTVQMIEKAGMEDIFQGTNPDYEKITFLGIKNYSIIRHVWDKQFAAGEDLTNEDNVVEALSSEECRSILLQYIIKGKYLKEDIKFRDYNYLIFDAEQTGFTELTTEGGSVIRAYLEQADYSGVPRAGAVSMFLFSMNTFQFVTLVTPDIQPSNGVVHALSGDHILEKL